MHINTEVNLDVASFKLLQNGDGPMQTFGLERDAHTHTHTHTHACTHMHTTQIHMRAHTRTHVHAHMYSIYCELVYMCMHAYIHEEAFSHTHTQRAVFQQALNIVDFATSGWDLI